MILWLIRFLRGFVCFRIFGSFPERFVNLSVKRGVGVFSVEPHSEYFEAKMLLSEYRFIRPVARRSGVRLRITERHGLPFFINRNKKRWGLGIGLLVLLIACVTIHNFFWIIEINGCETVSKTSLLSSLEEKGVKQGRFKGNLDLHRIERDIQLEFEEIGWMSINVSGSKVEVEIKEKSKVPDLEYSPEYCNIKAKSDGVILSANVRRGTAEVTPGSGVSKGQLLVSGFYENALGEIHFVDADADIVAETKYTFTSACNLRTDYIKPCSEATRSKLEVMWFSFPISFSPEEPLSSSYTETKQISIYDKLLPVRVKTQYLQSFYNESKNISQKEAEKILKTDLALYKLFALKNAEEIKDTVNFAKGTDLVSLTATINCRENIAVKEKFVVNE